MNAQVSLDLEKIISETEEEGDNFGWSCSVHNNIIIIGSSGKKNKHAANIKPDMGAVYIFEKNYLGKWNQIQFLEPDTNKFNCFFGGSVSIFNDYVVVGASGENIISNSDTGPGSVYIYKKNKEGKWLNSQRLLPDSSLRTVRFGTCVSINSNHIAISAIGESSSISGKVIIYQLVNDQWVFSEIIEPPKEKSCFIFGYVVSVFKKNLIVSSGGFCDNVFIYECQKNGKWALQSVIEAEHKNGTFGTAVSITDKYAVIGDEEDTQKYNDAKSSTGAVFIYKKELNNWNINQKLTLRNPKGGSRFGSKVSLNDSILVVGAYGETLEKQKKDEKSNIKIDQIRGAKNAGAAYLFKLKTNGKWEEDARLIPKIQNGWDKFGFSVSVWKKTIVIGARLEDIEGKTDAGAAYIYEVMK